MAEKLESSFSLSPPYEHGQRDSVPSRLVRRRHMKFHDHSRCWSAELTRIFEAVIEANGSGADLAGPAADGDGSTIPGA